MFLLGEWTGFPFIIELNIKLHNSYCSGRTSSKHSNHSMTAPNALDKGSVLETKIPQPSPYLYLSSQRTQLSCWLSMMLVILDFIGLEGRH